MLISAKRVAAFVSVTLVVGVLGCSGLRRGPAQASAPIEPEPTIGAPPVAEQTRVAAAVPNDTAVAAIEEFLERTRDYARPSVGASPTERPAVRETTAPVPSITTEARTPGSRPVEPSMGTAPGPSEVDPRMGSASPVGAVPPNGMSADSAPRGEPADPSQFSAQHAAFAAMERQAPATPNGTPQTVVPSTVLPQPQVPRPALPVLQSMTIRAGHVATTAAAQAMSASSRGVSNVPVDVVDQPRKATWQALIEDIESDPSSIKDFESTWRLGLARLAVGRGQPKELPPDGLLKESRQLFDALFAAASSVRGLVADPVGTGEHALTLVDALRERVAERSDPVVANVALCSRVTTFGVFEPMGPEDVVAGKPTQTIVYSEIDNLHAVQRDDGRYETRLSTRVEVLTSDGQSVWEHVEPEIVDQCRRRRRDFFLAQRVTFPATLPAGSYVLKVMVEDLLSGRTDEAIQPFVISSALSLAGHYGK